MAVLPGKTWGSAKRLVPSKPHRSSGCNRNDVRRGADGPAHGQGTGARPKRSMKFCRCSLSRQATLRAASHVRLARLMQTELVELRPQGREVALC
jgi:hypothetical protein